MTRHGKLSGRSKAVFIVRQFLSNLNQANGQPEFGLRPRVFGHSQVPRVHAGNQIALIREYYASQPGSEMRAKTALRFHFELVRLDLLI